MLQTHFSAIEAYRLLLAMPVKQRKEADNSASALVCAGPPAILRILNTSGVSGLLM